MNDNYVPRVLATNPDYLRSNAFKQNLADSIAKGMNIDYKGALNGSVITEEAITRNMSQEQKNAWKANNAYKAGAYKRALMDKEIEEQNLNASLNNSIPKKNNKILLIGGIIFSLVIIGLLIYYFKS